MCFLFLQVIQCVTGNQQIEIEDVISIELMSYLPLEDLIP